MKFLKKLNLKKTWPYFTAIVLLCFLIFVFCECLSFALLHYEELKFMDEEFAFGISNFTAVFFFWGFLFLYLICSLIKWTFSFFSDCIKKHMRKDD